MVARIGTGTSPGNAPIVVALIVDVDGTDGADVLNGDENHNLMRGFGGDDRMFGFLGDDLLIGGTGADFLDGGAGNFDTVGYMDSTVGVTVNLALGFGRFGTAEGDRLVNVDDIIGSPHRDTLIGTGDTNRLMGEVGDDMLTGGFGADFLFGGDGGNPPPGPSPADGNDTAVYSDSPVGVTVNLATGRGFGGTAEGDTLVSIENITGSIHNDVLTGNDVANFLHSSHGDDILKGAGGADILHGNAGNDTLKGGGGADVLEGNAGIDTAAYNDSPAGVFVSLITDTADFGDAEGDQLFNIENLTGTAFHDDLWGNDGVNVLTGMAGNDTLKGFGGDDTLNGGAGADIEILTTTNSSGTAAINLTGNSTSNSVRGNNGNNTLNGGAGGDELIGLGGQDRFLFDTALGPSNIDSVVDFNVADDTILLDDFIFSSSLGLGNISPGEFVIGAAALDGNDRIIYNSATGALLYDADANGANPAVRFATLSTGLALTNLDFLVV